MGHHRRNSTLHQEEAPPSPGPPSYEELDQPPPYNSLFPVTKASNTEPLTLQENHVTSGQEMQAALWAFGIRWKHLNCHSMWYTSHCGANLKCYTVLALQFTSRFCYRCCHVHKNKTVLEGVKVVQ
jgi:hypothetical protein